MLCVGLATNLHPAPASLPPCSPTRTKTGNLERSGSRFMSALSFRMEACPLIRAPAPHKNGKKHKVSWLVSMKARRHSSNLVLFSSTFLYLPAPFFLPASQVCCVCADSNRPSIRHAPTMPRAERVPTTPSGRKGGCRPWVFSSILSCLFRASRVVFLTVTPPTFCTRTQPSRCRPRARKSAPATMHILRRPRVW